MQVDQTGEGDVPLKGWDDDTGARCSDSGEQQPLECSAEVVEGESSTVVQ